MSINTRAAVAETIGTFTLCFVGAGSIIVDSHTHGGLGLVGIAIAHGLALSLAVSVTMNISGGQINPAITLGLILIGKEKGGQGAANIIGQLVGACIAGLLLHLLFPAEAVEAVKMGTPTLAEGIGAGTGIALEAVATFLLAMAIYGTAVGSKAPKGLAGFGIGLTIAFLILAIGPLTGAAMNPARHFGTAVFAGEFSPMWIYWVGPAIGSIIGFQVFSRILEPGDGEA